MSGVDVLSISCEIFLMRMPQDPIDDKSTLVQVMVRCRQATSHYLTECWPSFITPYGVTIEENNHDNPWGSFPCSLYCVKIYLSTKMPHNRYENTVGKASLPLSWNDKKEDVDLIVYMFGWSLCFVRTLDKNGLQMILADITRPS